MTKPPEVGAGPHAGVDLWTKKTIENPDFRWEIHLQISLPKRMDSGDAFRKPENTMNHDILLVG